MYLPVSLFHVQTAVPIYTKFCTDLHTNSSLTLPTQPPDPGVPQALEPKQITEEKTLLYKKCPDGWLNLIKFFPASNGPQLVSK